MEYLQGESNADIGKGKGIVKWWNVDRSNLLNTKIVGENYEEIEYIINRTVNGMVKIYIAKMNAKFTEAEIRKFNVII